MVPFDVKINGKKVGISWESLFWFFIVTAGATAVGNLVYEQWVGPWFTKLLNPPAPALATISPSAAAAPLVPSDPTVVSVQTPASVTALNGRKKRGA